MSETKKRVPVATFLAGAAIGLGVGASTDIITPAAASVVIEDETQYADLCITAGQAAAIGGQLVPEACAEFQTRPGLDAATCGNPNFKAAWVRRVDSEDCGSGFKARTRGTFPATVTYD